MSAVLRDDLQAALGAALSLERELDGGATPALPPGARPSLRRDSLRQSHHPGTRPFA